MYIKEIISDYTVLDVETTGLSSYYDAVIEIGLLKIRNDQITDKYSQLIDPGCEIPNFVTALTGITDDMVKGMPSFMDIREDISRFIGDDVIIGHNTSFDLNFLKNGIGIEIEKHMDTMQFARKVFPELKHHRLSDLTEYLDLSNNEHRALADCVSTFELYSAMKSIMSEKDLGIDDLWHRSKRQTGNIIDSIHPESMEIDEDGFFYGRHVVFTGTLEKMVRKDAMQLVVNLGGILDKSVTKETNYLILGNTDYNPSLRGEKSSKQKKAEALKSKGQDIEVIDEFTFYDLLNI